MTYPETIEKINNNLNTEIKNIEEKFQRSIDLWKEIYGKNFNYCDSRSEGYNLKEKIINAKNEALEKAKNKAEEEKSKAKEEAINNLETLIKSF